MAPPRKAKGSRAKTKGGPDDEYLDPEKLNMRSTYGMKIRPYLVQGVEEVRKQTPSFKMTDKDIWKLTNQICDSLHDYFSYDKREFKQKMFDIYANIKRENNQDLRRKIVTGTISVYNLIHADTRELAPQDLKRKREIALEQHYLRNVILSGNKQDRNDRTERKSGDPQEATEAIDNSEETTEDSGSESSEDVASISDGFLASESNSPQSHQDPGEAEEKPLRLDTGQPQSQKLKDDSRGDNVAEETKTETDSPLKDVLLALQQKKVGPEEEGESDTLPEPPDMSEYKLEKIMAKIKARLDELPSYIAKPFRGPLKCGHKRVTLLMESSPILTDES